MWAILGGQVRHPPHTLPRAPWDLSPCTLLGVVWVVGSTAGSLHSPPEQSLCPPAAIPYLPFPTFSLILQALPCPSPSSFLSFIFSLSCPSCLLPRPPSRPRLPSPHHPCAFGAAPGHGLVAALTWSLHHCPELASSEALSAPPPCGWTSPLSPPWIPSLPPTLQARSPESYPLQSQPVSLCHFRWSCMGEAEGWPAPWAGAASCPTSRTCG